MAQERHDGRARVTTDDGDVLARWVGRVKLRDEAAGAHHVEGGDTEQLLRVVDTLALEDFGGDGDGAVDWVGDDEDGGVRASVGGGFGEVADNGGVCVE